MRRAIIILSIISVIILSFKMADEAQKHEGQNHFCPSSENQRWSSVAGICLKKGEIKVGIHQADLWWSMGVPDKISTYPSSYGISEYYFYRGDNSATRSRRVVLMNNFIVSAWIDNWREKEGNL